LASTGLASVTPALSLNVFLTTTFEANLLTQPQIIFTGRLSTCTRRLVAGDPRRTSAAPDSKASWLTPRLVAASSTFRPAWSNNLP
jgi:hypothetical protein